MKRPAAAPALPNDTPVLIGIAVPALCVTTAALMGHAPLTAAAQLLAAVMAGLGDYLLATAAWLAVAG